ncbi:MAG: MraY family glycosyltransferase [Candidatus Dormibacteraceae bacterium]
MTDFFGGDALFNLRDRLLPGLWPLLVALVVCAIAVPLVIRMSRRIGVIAMPSERHAHSKPTPALGGLAMYVGFGAAVVLLVPINITTIGLLVVCGLATLLLIADDRSPVRPLVKLGMQVTVAVVAVVVFGDILMKEHHFVISFFGLPGVGIVDLGLLATPVSIFWLMGMQNTVNFLDGADGLAAGVVFIVAITLMLAAAGQKQIQVVQVSGALAGACAGFLFFNWHPAKIFMGDSGAHFLGTALGVISILGVAKVAVAFALAVPMLALAVPIADTVWAILRRGRQRASIARPDLLHLHHRLQAFGLDQRQTCFVFYTATALLGALGLTLFGHGRILAVVAATCVVLTSTVAADLLMHTGWRIPAPFIRRLLGEPGTR